MPAFRRGTSVHTLTRRRQRVVTTVTLSSCRTLGVRRFVPSLPQPMARQGVPLPTPRSWAGSWATCTLALMVANPLSCRRDRTQGVKEAGQRSPPGAARWLHHPASCALPCARCSQLGSEATVNSRCSVRQAVHHHDNSPGSNQSWVPLPLPPLQQTGAGDPGRHACRSCPGPSSCTGQGWAGPVPCWGQALHPGPWRARDLSGLGASSLGTCPAGSPGESRCRSAGAWHQSRSQRPAGRRRPAGRARAAADHGHPAPPAPTGSSCSKGEGSRPWVGGCGTSALPGHGGPEEPSLASRPVPGWTLTGHSHSVPQT